MNQYLELIVMLVQVILFQFISSPMFRVFTYRISLNRNTQWLKENPDALIECPIPNGKFHLLMGSIFIVLGLLDFFSIGVVKGVHIHTASALLMITQYLTIDLPLYNKMKKIIPKGVRSTAMKERKLFHYLKPWQVNLAIFLTLANVILWSLHYFSLESLTTKNYLLIGLNIFAYSVIIWAIRVGITRTPISNDLLIDDVYRRLEIKTSFYAFLSLAILKIVQLLRVAYFNESEVLLILKSSGGIIPLLIYGVFLYFAKQTIQALPGNLNET